MFFTRYNWKRVVSVNEGIDLTEQHHLETTNINKIVSTFNRTGRIISSNKRPAFYGDISSMPKDILETQDMKLRAVNALRALPVKVQERFGRNPEELLAFLSDPSNRDEAISLGLLDSSCTPAPAPMEPVQGAPVEKLDI